MAIGNRSILLVPIFGWAWFFNGSIFLRRAWESDKKVLEHDVQQLIDGYPDHYYFHVRSVRIHLPTCSPPVSDGL